MTCTETHIYEYYIGRCVYTCSLSVFSLRFISNGRGICSVESVGLRIRFLECVNGSLYVQQHGKSKISEERDYQRRF
jgi:hypothetical protein